MTCTQAVGTNLTYLRVETPRAADACACNVYQALSPPPLEGPGYESTSPPAFIIILWEPTEIAAKTLNFPWSLPGSGGSLFMSLKEVSGHALTQECLGTVVLIFILTLSLTHTHTHTHIRTKHTLKGLTLSLDSLLKTDQMCTTTVCAVAETVMSLGQSSKHELARVSASTQLPRSVDKGTYTAPCDSKVAERSQMHDPSLISTSVDANAEPAYKAMIHCHDMLVTAFSAEIITISGALFTKEFITDETRSKMLLPDSIPREKAAILVKGITDMIKISPKRFDELMIILSEHTCAKEVVPRLYSQLSHDSGVNDSDHDQDIEEVIPIDQPYKVSKDHTYTPWASLDPDDKIDLEARLLTDAETIGHDFALLCCKARDSFTRRGITPQDLAYVLLDLMAYKPSSRTSIPLLEQEKNALMTAQSVQETFNVLRPHMSFFNYEILQFLIQGKGSESDNAALAVYMQKFATFCKRHVFEVPQLFNGHQIENQKVKQRLHIKVTEHFKAAFLLTSTDGSVALPSESPTKTICSSKLGIKLEDAKTIQRKFASILNLNPSSLFLDTISEGSVILTFLLPAFVSLTGLDDNPEVVQLSSNGISILCGPPGKLKLIDLTQSGVIIRWSQPEYGCKSLAQYTVYFQNKGECETTEWQKLELGSQETHTCVPDLSDGDSYVFRICTVSDVGTLQYSDQSDPIVISTDGILRNNVHKVIIANRDMLTSAFTSADSNTIAAVLSIKGVTSREDESQISLASTPVEKATLLVSAIEHHVKSSPEKFQDLLNALRKPNLSLPDYIVETLKLWSDYYDNDMLLISALSSADYNKVAAVLSIKGVISDEDEALISLLSTQTEKGKFLISAMENRIEASPEKFQNFLTAAQRANLTLHDYIVEALKDKEKLKSAFSSADCNTIAAVLSIKGVISKDEERQISLASTHTEKKHLVSAIERQVRNSPEKIRDFLRAIQQANLTLPDDIVVTLWSDFYDKDVLIAAFSSADPDTIAVVLSRKGVISKEDEVQISRASTLSRKATSLVTAIKRQMKRLPKKFQDFLNAILKSNLSLPGDVVEILWSDYYDIVYKQYLDYLYSSLDNKQRSSDQWPPSVTKKLFRLAMILSATVRRGYIENSFVQMTITGKVDDILQEKYPIQLEDIFKESESQRKVTIENVDQRKVILLEGAPGCGKSTLSVYICQQWEKGQLFNQFKLVILVRLRDPAVQNAEGLADLLPCSNAKTAQLLAGIMMEMKCQDVLFVLDGWDELPLDLRRKSIFGDLISPYLPSSNPLSKSTVIVTSRPIASGDLHQVVASRVEILGFTAEKLHEFFTECLEGDTEAVKSLLERIEQNPEAAGSCYLPLNATIFVHLFKSDRNTLPTTLYGIFSSLVLNCIRRHLKLRTQYKHVSVKSLDQLPECAKKPFSFLCQLAYYGVIKDRIVFTSLPADFNSLSLLQGVESFIGREKAVSYNFIHLSIQELLAAWYIATQLPASDQVSQFNELFDKSRFSAVFRFYAAITKLTTPGIRDVVIRMARKKEKSLLVSLLHCLYEAQDPSLCDFVVQQLQRGLDLEDTTLTPSDCNCIGYFLAHVCQMAAGEFIVYLNNCSIDDQGCKYLVSGLHKHLNTQSSVATLLHIDMFKNAIGHHGVQHLSTLLKIGCVNFLTLSNNDLLSEHVQADTTLAPLSTFARELKKNNTLKTLWLQGCGLNSQCAETLAEALTTNRKLEKLLICSNVLSDDGIQHFARALRVNQGLKELYMESCGMTDKGLVCLAKSVQHNNTLTRLYVNNLTDSSNRLTEKIIPILTECLRNNRTLTTLMVPENLESSTATIQEAVNDIRRRSGLPLIKVSWL